ncbi:putative ATP-dependent RNA helicase DBP6 [Aspergillus puulaauensis]|uniref:ATP-dependent RNA helicase n=1 Tax=Aspergillus puulaauensis TaxID=1220207 RepID=A0A7R7XBV2_9EURO|nr:ATP-dependent RNA helicase dbp6 [Aspergillus puulaauensis]BCS18562.1 ATP-dependent RNA helicase dbp6 [Aspergillus puulaauensis]
MAGDRAVTRDIPMSHASPPTSGKKSQKRKRDLDGSTGTSSTPTKKSKKDRNDRNEKATPVSPREKRKKEKRSDSTSVDKASKESSKKKRAVSPSSDKTKPPGERDRSKSKKKSRSEKQRSPGSDSDADEELENPIDKVKKQDNSKETAKDSGKTKKSKKSEPGSTAEGEDISKPAKNKFAGILSKFERSAKVKEAAAEKGYGEDETTEKNANTPEPVIAQGLEPIPQPEPALEEAEKPTYSSLPAWLANPLKTSAETRAKFSELGIEPKLLGVLEDNGYKEAFAVQSAVIPLLLKDPKSHSGDLCVSAATGSGKTLSYVLPLVTELEQIPAPRLRGLIVVPTRELVKQARETCEFCTAGTGLRVGSAVGNVAIKDEQRSLMRVDQLYSPESIESRQKSLLTEDDWTEFSLQDYISSTTDLGETLPGYVHKAEPNVDILICTPGRLVDHIRYTKDFTLKHLQWLVIDEADRLLNESFQEWVDVVMHSLDARKGSGAFGSSGQFLSSLGLPLQTKEPRKVILSATMTRDISKLNSLRLTNPQLVVVGASDQAPTGDIESGVIAHSDDKFSLPTTLKEYSVAVGDGAQKPLYLLRLLLSEIKLGVSSSTKPTKPAVSDSDETSSEGTSSDETSSDDSSSKDSESDSDDSDSDSADDSSSSDESDSSDSSSDSESDSEAEKTTKASSNNPSERSTVLVFTKSSESASRLSRLLALLDPSLSGLIGTIIKSNKSSASRKTLSAYRQGKLSIIIATDRASRGLDLQSLTHVINYDVPASITTYVHRVGRTARAGREGSAWTLVAHREGRWFTNEISKGANGKITRAAKVERVAIKLDNMKELKSRYASALEILETEVKYVGTRKIAR